MCIAAVLMSVKKVNNFMKTTPKPVKANANTISLKLYSQKILVYKLPILVVVALVILGGYYLKVSSFVNVERDEAVYAQELNTQPSSTISSKVLERIEEMNASGAKNPGTDLRPDRTNPFAD